MYWNQVYTQLHGLPTHYIGLLIYAPFASLIVFVFVVFAWLLFFEGLRMTFRGVKIKCRFG